MGDTVVTSDPTTTDPGEAPSSLADHLTTLRQRAGLSEVHLFRITSGRNGQRTQRLLRFPEEEASRPLGQDFHFAVRMVSETATPFIITRRERRRDDEASASGAHRAVTMIAPIFTFADNIWGAVAGVSPVNEATGAAFRLVIQTAAQIGGQISSWGRPRTAPDPAPVRLAPSISMTSSVALLHELRTPLTASGFALDILDHSHIAPDDEAGQRALRTLRLGLAEAIHLVQWWDEAQKKGQIEAHIKPIPIVAALRRSLALSEFHSQRVHVSVAPETPMALADELLLSRVFLNLIENAYRHGQPGGALEISAAAAGNVVQVRFLNEGVMTDASMRHIRDSTSTDATRSEERGHGYGLGIVKALLHTMAGSLEVESDAQQGTAFTVRLPMAQPARGDTVD